VILPVDKFLKDEYKDKQQIDLDAVQGRSEERTEVYAQYSKEVPQLLTQ